MINITALLLIGLAGIATANPHYARTVAMDIKRIYLSLTITECLAVHFCIVAAVSWVLY